MSGIDTLGVMKIVSDNEFVLVRGSVEALLVTTNGPAIKGGCVTWRSHPATSPGTLAGKLSRWQDRYGVLFAVMVQSLLPL
jgi:hypothetical protein